MEKILSLVRRFVEDYEAAHDAARLDDLWNAIRAVGRFSLAKQRQSGLTDEGYVKDQLRRYEFFVPLRGFHDETAESVYAYMDDYADVGNPVRTAHGRESEADNPFGGLLTVAYRSISSGNRNKALQAFYNLVSGHDTDNLAVVSNAWVENMGTEDAPDWQLVTPNIDDRMSGEEVNEEMERFEGEMKKKAEVYSLSNI